MKPKPKFNLNRFGPITQDHFVYIGFTVLAITIFAVNGFDAVLDSATGQFIAATNIYPIDFETTTETTTIPDNPIIVSTSYRTEEPKTDTCKVNLDGYSKVGEQTTDKGKTFQLYNSTNIIIVPKDNPEQGNVVLKTTSGGTVKITSCGTLTEQGLLFGSGKDAIKFDLGQLDSEGKPKTFTAKIKKDPKTKKSEPIVVNIL